MGPHEDLQALGAPQVGDRHGMVEVLPILVEQVVVVDHRDEEMAKQLVTDKRDGEGLKDLQVRALEVAEVEVGHLRACLGFPYVEVVVGGLVEDHGEGHEVLCRGEEVAGICRLGDDGEGGNVVAGGGNYDFPLEGEAKYDCRGGQGAWYDYHAYRMVREGPCDQAGQGDHGR